MPISSNIILRGVLPVFAMMFVVAIATLIVNICDALLRRDSAEINTIRAI